MPITTPITATHSLSALRSIGAIAKTTLLDAIRNKLLTIVGAFTAFLIAFSVIMASLSIMEYGRLIIDIGLFAISGIGGLVAIALTIASTTAELENKTAYPVLAGPIARHTFLFGKFVGICAAMTIVISLMYAALSAALFFMGGKPQGAVLASYPIACIEMILICAVSILFSSISKPVVATLLSLAVVTAGRFSNELSALAEKLASKENAMGAAIINAINTLLPNLDLLSLRSEAANNLPYDTTVLWIGPLYGLVYAAMAVTLAAIVFSKRRFL